MFGPQRWRLVLLRGLWLGGMGERVGMGEWGVCCVGRVADPGWCVGCVVWFCWCPGSCGGEGRCGPFLYPSSLRGGGEGG